jgi:hypothetical protein
MIGRANIGGNWFCQPVNTIQYSNFGSAGTNNRTVAINTDGTRRNRGLLNVPLHGSLERLMGKSVQRPSVLKIPPRRYLPAPKNLLAHVQSRGNTATEPMLIKVSQFQFQLNYKSPMASVNLPKLRSVERFCSILPSAGLFPFSNWACNTSFEMADTPLGPSLAVLLSF